MPVPAGIAGAFHIILGIVADAVIGITGTRVLVTYGSCRSSVTGEGTVWQSGLPSRR